MVVEQRITLRSVQELTKQVIDKTLTHSKFFDARKDIKDRENKIPVNLLIFMAMLNTLFGIITVFLWYYDMGECFTCLFVFIFCFVGVVSWSVLRQCFGLINA